MKLFITFPSRFPNGRICEKELKIYHFFKENLDIVFFIYGLAFVVMGLSISLQPRRKDSEFKIATIFWLLAAFGLTHGTNEFLDMWTIHKGRVPSLDIIRWFILIISYLFLFEFGRRLYIITAMKSPTCHYRIVRFLGWWLLPIISSIILIAGFTSSDFWKTGSIFTRYLLGFPGGLLIGYGFFLYYTCEKSLLRNLNVKHFFYLGGASFLFYGTLGGLIVPEADFFPANFLNTDSFMETFKLPVQALRSVCAITAAVSVSGMLKIFDWETNSKLQLYQNRLRTTMSKLSIVEEQERKRISEELHDNIGQNLALSKIKLASLQGSCRECSEELNETRNLIDEAIRFTRSLAFDLSPPILYELGFNAAIEWLTEQVREKYGIITAFVSDPVVDDMKKEPRVLLFKTIRELLINVVKHAGASKVTITIRDKGDTITFNVQDNGTGFDPDTVGMYSFAEGGLGIMNIREKIKYLGGNFEISSGKGEGTIVSISLPKNTIKEIAR